MQSTPNRISKIPRPGTLSPRFSQGSKSPQGSGSSEEPKSPQQLEKHAPAPFQDEYPLVSHLTQGLKDCDWEQLQDKYADAMEEHGRVEENLRVETAKLLEVNLSPYFNQTLISEQSHRFSWPGLKPLFLKMKTEL
jgi:hypothetical protein